jgi:Second Messenger Oligonucleotide or Dinucleotide Synthetase domain
MATAPALHFTESIEAQLDDLLMRICVDLQLDETRYKLAERSYRGVGTWLESQSLVARLHPNIYAQGSILLGTTVRPLSGEEFDLDFVCEFICGTHFFGRPVDALNLIERALKSNLVYAPMVERKNRCIRLNYAHEFHLDILPACKDPRNGNTCILVPDRKLGEWVPSNPLGYGSWFNDRSRQSLIRTMVEKATPLPTPQRAEHKPPLKLCVQLWKRRRDIRHIDEPASAPISIILTTLAGSFYRGEQSVTAAMANVLQSTVDAVKSSPSRLVVVNPSNPLEDLSERWDLDVTGYKEFVDGVTEFRDQWTALHRARGIDNVAKSLEFLFGESITKRVIEKQVHDIEAARTSNQLQIKKASGILAGSAGASTMRVKPNTFYGD